MDSSGAANFTGSPQKCSTGPGFFFTVTTDVLVAGILSCLLDVVNILISVPLNLLVVLTISLNSSLQDHNANWLLLLLAASDFLIGAVMEPLVLVNKIQHLLSRPSCTTAAAHAVVRVLIVCASIVSQMLVSLERTLCVLVPYWYGRNVTVKRLFAAHFCLLFVWTLVDLLIRFALLSTKSANLFSGGVLVVFLVANVICYGMMIRVANRHESQTQAQQQQLQLSEEERRKIKRERKALWIAIYINTAYFTCYLPSVPTVIAMVTADSSTDERFLLYCWMTTIVCLVASANPIILSWRNARLHKKMKKLIRLNNIAPQVDSVRQELQLAERVQPHVIILPST